MTYLAEKKTSVSSQPQKQQDEFSYQRANGEAHLVHLLHSSSEVTDGQIKAELGAEGGKHTQVSCKGISV